ncbi:hypothetical protein BD289DRAFT_421179 [Coniella lustricola]|uniref:Uncharacterized protein n=1 Tax=Coniella lustricola TaxID=2025994 RepID=A0A2T3ALX7_9PEZI|nr:hypothetical protein BD289DRAFT_421179 [Coniella lustricola]
MLLEVAGVKLRLLGLGGAVVMHKLFDNGEGRTTIAGGQGTMWTTLLQMGELVDTANRVYDPTETRVFVTHASPAREGILNQLSVNLKADFSISAGLHFRYGSSYNEFSVNPTLDHYRGKLAASKASFNDVWETVKAEVEPAIQHNEAQQSLLNNALSVVEKMPSQAAGGNPFGGAHGGVPAMGQVDESAFKNMWNFNLADAAFGWLVLEIQDGRIGTEMKAQGFNFSHRGAKQQPMSAAAAAAAAPPVAAAPPSAPSQAPAPAPQRQASQQLAKNSPAPTQTKPATPAPEVNAKENDKPAGANGNAHGADSAAPSPAPPKASDIIGLFVMNTSSVSDEDLRKLFASEDQPKVVDVLKWGQANKVVQFKTTEDRDGALERLPEENKTGGDRTKPVFKLFTPRGRDFTARTGNAGTWGSSRGVTSSTGRGSGYQSSGAGGTASDSEGAGRRGGRSGRGRGGERGGRGRGRGGGGLKGEGGNGSPATPAAAPAAES